MAAVTSGAKTASGLLNEWLVDLFYDKEERPGGALTKKINLILCLRGGASGFLKQGQQPMVHEINLHQRCLGGIVMPPEALPAMPPQPAALTIRYSGTRPLKLVCSGKNIPRLAAFTNVTTRLRWGEAVP